MLIDDCPTTFPLLTTSAVTVCSSVAVSFAVNLPVFSSIVPYCLLFSDNCHVTSSGSGADPPLLSTPIALN